MTYESFLQLHDKLSDGITQAACAHKLRWLAEAMPGNRRGNCLPKKGRANYKPPPVPNGVVATSVRLACALRYFAGGSPCDLMGKYGISHTQVLDSVWNVVEAINRLRKFFIEYPSDHKEQENIASGFRQGSAVDFDNCAGAIDGILIWIQKPTIGDAAKSGIGMKKLYCGRKHKFGLNCQAVSDKRGRFLDISIKHGGSSADCLAFEASDFYKRLEDGLLSPGLVIFGDSAYLNSPYMATPYSNVSSGSKDDYNFYHSQVSLKEYFASMIVFLFCIITLIFLSGLYSNCLFDIYIHIYEFGSSVLLECLSRSGLYYEWQCQGAFP
jgi:hypothetical protein